MFVIILLYYLQIFILCLIFAVKPLNLGDSITIFIDKDTIFIGYNKIITNIFTQFFMQQDLTFKEIYLKAKDKPSPGQAFINEISNITMRRPSTVRMWLNGTQSPDSLAKKQISEYLHISVETLFPPKNS